MIQTTHIDNVQRSINGVLVGAGTYYCLFPFLKEETLAVSIGAGIAATSLENQNAVTAGLVLTATTAALQHSSWKALAYPITGITTLLAYDALLPSDNRSGLRIIPNWIRPTPINRGNHPAGPRPWFG